MFLGLVLTARHGMEGGSAGSPRSNIGVHSKITNWAKVVTRYPYENVRMDYLLIECAYLLLLFHLLVGEILKFPGQPKNFKSLSNCSLTHSK